MNKEIESRRVSVERLAIEGNSQEDIADILEVPLRTVERDIAAIREANVIARDEKSVAAQVIKFIARAEGRMGGLLRRADKRDCPYPQQIDAEWKAWLVARGLVQDLRAMGYLPNAAKEVRADVTHHVEKKADLVEAAARVVEFEKILIDAGRMDEKARADIAAMKAEIAEEATSQQ